MAINRKLVPFLGAFGYPPGTYVSDDMIVNSMPVAEFHPGEPDFTGGLTLFKLNFQKGEESYNNLLAKQGFSIKLPLKLAFIADNFPSDTFSNEYVETFLQKTTDVGSAALGQIVQMSGEKNALKAVEHYGGDIAAAGKELEGLGGKAITTFGETAMTGAISAQKLIDKANKSESATARLIGGGAEMINKMMSGHRVDFPQIWSNSGFTPSYSITVRLYNPYPGNPESTKQHISGPLAAILCMMIPRSESAHSYRWPLYQKIKVRGLYELNPCAITSVTVIKGGDQQQIAYNQNMGIVDVRIDYVALHRSILAEEGEGKNKKFENRPTLRSYLNAIEDVDPDTFITRRTMRSEIGKKVGAEIQQDNIITARKREKEQIVKNLKVSRRLKQAAEAVAAASRTPFEASVVEVQSIIERNPSGVNNLDLAERYGVPAVTQAWENLGCVVGTQGSPNSNFFRMTVDC